MDTLRKLDDHLHNRPIDLKKMKEKGKKIIAYFAGEFVPEEMIYAAGAIPIGLVHGGSGEEVDAAGAYMHHALCPFSKTQFALFVLNQQPYYRLMDLLVVPVPCIHLHRAADCYEYYTDIDVFRLGVPHQSMELELNYFADAQRRLKEKIEGVVGTEIKIEELKKAISLYNRMRNLLKQISLLRTQDPPALSGLEFMKINHASFYADPTFMVEILQSLYEELQERRLERNGVKPRILLTGPNLARGDYKIFELAEGEGKADVVVEEAFEGVRFYWQNVEEDGDPYQNLAQRYLRKFPPAGIMRKSTIPRSQFLSKLAKDFEVDGVFWYQIRLCECYDMESHWFKEYFDKELSLPMLKLVSNYDALEFGYNKTRVDTFIDMLKTKKSNE
jgi:Benzoyl-CoA reductase/2-hydroxyglutaryl-CoA dehydratase subunit, BcrC/BadD/HgdB